VAEQPLFTFFDLTESLWLKLGGSASGKDKMAYIAAAKEAMREFVGRHEWSYYYARMLVQTVASYATGTVAYDHTGGANERQLTLSSGSWPDWIEDGWVVISNVPYEVESQVSSTIVTLSPLSNPGADVASGTSYKAYRDAYPLPSDFVQLHSPFIDYVNQRGLVPGTANQLLQHQRLLVSPGEPTVVSVYGDPNYAGRKAVVFSPPPSAARTYGALYRRRPRPLVIEKENTGTISVTADSSAVTGTGTAFTSRHVGCVIRPGTVSAEPSALNPATEERVITGYTSSTSVTVDAPWDDSHTGVKFIISDPVDADQGYINPILRLAEEKLAGKRDRDTYLADKARLEQELLLAMEADGVYAVSRVMGAPLMISERAMHLRYGRDSE
jgi:hypothetical protein